MEIVPKSTAIELPSTKYGTWSKLERDRLSKTRFLFGTLGMWNVSTPHI
jgi:hypothetical protein